MKRIAALPIAALILSASAFAVTFTQGPNQSCAYNTYVISGQLVHRFGCSLIPTDQTYVDGSPVYQSFWADMTANADNSGGTFTGGLWLDRATLVNFTGTYTGNLISNTSATILGIQGGWGSGNVTSAFGVHQIGGYRGSKVSTRYLMAGSGSF